MIVDKQKIQETVDYLAARTGIKPEVGVILGSGLGAVVDMLENAVHIPYGEIPNFPVSSVKGHGGQLAFGTCAGKGVVVQEGRVHFYEGLPAHKILYPLFVMKALGVKTIINTNAAGGINPDFNAAMLAEAMCKLEGFTFEPNADIYWQQGRSSETDFIYVTTQMMTKEMLTKLSDEVGPNRSLLICCGAFRCDVTQFENLPANRNIALLLNAGIRLCTTCVINTI